MSTWRAATPGARVASSFSSAIRNRNLPLRVNAAAASIIIRRNSAGRRWQAARGPHGRAGSFVPGGRSQKILLGEFDAGMAQDVVGRGDVKEELRHAERQ